MNPQIVDPPEPQTVGAAGPGERGGSGSVEHLAATQDVPSEADLFAGENTVKGGESQVGIG